MVLNTEVDELVSDIQLGKKDLREVIECYMKLCFDNEESFDKRLEEQGISYEKDIEDLDNEIDEFEDKIGNLDDRISDLNYLIGELRVTISNQEKEIDRLEDRLNREEYK